MRTFDRARYGFGALASIATGFEQYHASPAQTARFRKLDAMVGGAIDFVFGVALPMTAIIDGVSNFTLPKLAPNLKVEAGGFISGNLATAVRGAVAYAEGVATGEASLKRLHLNAPTKRPRGTGFDEFGAPRQRASRVRRSVFPCLPCRWAAPCSAAALTQHDAPRTQSAPGGRSCR